MSPHVVSIPWIVERTLIVDFGVGCRSHFRVEAELACSHGSKVNADIRCCHFFNSFVLLVQWSSISMKGSLVEANHR